jgi:GNAT superfamily N-acetyltransferase
MIEVRPARNEDSEHIARLMQQLGYDVAAEKLADRLRRRAEHRDILVAVSDENVVGWVGVSAYEHFVEGFSAHVEGLVVDEASRSRGVGERLLAAAESWARERGCSVMLVQSNVIRTRAHAFYARNGYATVKTQHHLRKEL